MAKFRKKLRKSKVKYMVLEREGGLAGSFKSYSAARKRSDRLNKTTSGDYYVMATKPFGSRKSQQRSRRK